MHPPAISTPKVALQPRSFVSFRNLRDPPYRSIKEASSTGISWKKLFTEANSKQGTEAISRLGSRTSTEPGAQRCVVRSDAFAHRQGWIFRAAWSSLFGSLRSECPKSREFCHRRAGQVHAYSPSLTRWSRMPFQLLNLPDPAILTASWYTSKFFFRMCPSTESPTRNNIITLMPRAFWMSVMCLSCSCHEPPPIPT